MPAPSTPVLHVPIGKGCDNACRFCMERGRGSPRRFSEEEVEAQLRRLRPLTEAVTFTSGEPTLQPGLVGGVARARALGFREVGLVTNGRRLAALLDPLLDAGLTDLVVSLHGPDAPTHDGITRRAGSFDETVAGLAAAGARLPLRPFRLQVNCTLVLANLGGMRALYELAACLGARAVNFNAVEPRGRADDDFDEVVPRYEAVMDAAMASGLDFRSPRASLSRVPPCAGGPDWTQEDWHLAHEAEVRRFDPAEGKVRGPPCPGCARAAVCPGIWERYARGHGWDGLFPVGDPAALASRTARVEARDGAGRALRRGWIAGYRRVVVAGTEGLGGYVGLARRTGYDVVAVELPVEALDREAAGLLAAGPDQVRVRAGPGDVGRVLRARREGLEARIVRGRAGQG